MLEGKFPSVDQYGLPLKGVQASRANQPICGGWKAAFSAWCGDWKERALSHVFQRRNYGSTLLCDQCKAVQPHKKTPAHLMQFIYTDFRVDAPWMSTLRSHDTYLEETPPSQRTPWLAVPGFNINRVCWDSAHTILLGCGKDVSAAFICDLVAWRLYNLSWLFVFLFDSVR